MSAKSFEKKCPYMSACTKCPPISFRHPYMSATYMYVAVWVQVGRRYGAARHGNCTSCGGSCAPVRSFLTPGLLPLFSTVTGRCLDARSSHYICSSTVTVRAPLQISPIPQSSSAKKVVRQCEFSEKFGILEKHHVSIVATKDAWFLNSLIFLLGTLLLHLGD